jgi:hypothetical protein
VLRDHSLRGDVRELRRRILRGCGRREQRQGDGGGDGWAERASHTLSMPNSD